MSNFYRISKFIHKTEQDDGEERKQAFAELESLAYKLQAVAERESSQK